jgi:hypothetical protein
MNKQSILNPISLSQHKLLQKIPEKEPKTLVLKLDFKKTGVILN